MCDVGPIWRPVSANISGSPIAKFAWDLFAPRDSLSRLRTISLSPVPLKPPFCLRQRLIQDRTNTTAENSTGLLPLLLLQFPRNPGTFRHPNDSGGGSKDRPGSQLPLQLVLLHCRLLVFVYFPCKVVFDNFPILGIDLVYFQSVYSIATLIIQLQLCATRNEKYNYCVLPLPLIT